MRFSKHILKRFLLLTPLLLLAGGILFSDSLFPGIPSGIQKVYAEEEDDEEEEHEEDDEEEDEERSQPEEPAPSVTKKKKVSKPVVETVIEYQPVTKTVVVTEPGYATDTDADGLVDALDPDPAVDQRAYFTDDDNDGMPNIWDSHPEQDDFTFLDEETDANGNGLLDSYE